MKLTFDLEPGDDVVYVAEAVEQIERIERGLLELEQNAANEATLAEIFRAAHTLKGSAATIGHGRMAELTHALEEVFGALRSGRLRDLAEFGDLLLPTVDVLRILVDEIAAGETLTDAPGQLARAIIDRLAVALAESEPADAPVISADTEEVANLDAARLDRLLGASVPSDGLRSLITFGVDAASPWSGVRLLQGLMAATETGRLLGSVPSLEEIESDTGGAVLSMLLNGQSSELEDLLGRLRAMDDTVRVEVHDIDDSAIATRPRPTRLPVRTNLRPAGRPPTPFGSMSGSSTT